MFSRKQQRADDWFGEKPAPLDGTSWDSPERDFFDDLGPQAADGKLRASEDDLFGDGPSADSHQDNALLFGDDPIFPEAEGDGGQPSDLVFTDVDAKEGEGSPRLPFASREQRKRALLAGAGASVLLAMTGAFGAILLSSETPAPSQLIIAGSPVVADAEPVTSGTAPDTTFLPPMPSTAAPVPIPTGVPVSAAPAPNTPAVSVSAPQSTTTKPRTTTPSSKAGTRPSGGNRNPVKNSTKPKKDPDRGSTSLPTPDPTPVPTSEVSPTTSTTQAPKPETSTP